MGWKDILWRVYDGATEARLFLIAAGITFYLILGLFPGIATLVSIYRLFVDPQTMVNHLDIVASVAPGGAVGLPAAAASWVWSFAHAAVLSFDLTAYAP
jgi:membrane protein